MAYTNSSLATVKVLSPNHSGLRNHAIDTITIHCVVGQCTAKRIGEIFLPESRKASSNYGIGYDGKIGLYVEEKNRSWCTSSSSNDNRAITIEVASDTKEPYAVTDKAYAALIDLVTDICKRNNIKELKWKGDKSLIGQVDKQNMTVHRWFANKSCPGKYLYDRHPQIAAEVNKRLAAAKQPEKAEATKPVTSSKSYEIGDVVDFSGKYQYTSSYATGIRKACKPGKVKITARNLKGKHPYHGIAVSGGGSNAYGWLNADDLGKVEATYSPKVGDKVKMTKNAPIYGKSTKFSSWVYNCTLFVREVDGDRVVVSTQKTGAVTGAVGKKYLTKV